MESLLNTTINQKLKFSIIVNLMFTIFECTIGIAIGSLALISDAAHNFTDIISLLVSLLARKMAEKEPTAKKTYGYGRATILAPLLNSSLLILLSGYIFKEAYNRFSYPEPIEGSIVLVVGLMGIIVNGGIALLFLKHKDDVNIKSALLNMFFDAIASAGALIAGCIIMITHQTLIDPIISIIIGTMLLITASRILADVIHILFEGVPQHIKLTDIETAIKNNPDVLGVDDLHIWSISSQTIALSCHIIIDSANLEKSVSIIHTIKQQLKRNFTIQHSTIEVELIHCTETSCAIFKAPK